MSPDQFPRDEAERRVRKSTEKRVDENTRRVLADEGIACPEPLQKDLLAVSGASDASTWRVTGTYGLSHAVTKWVKLDSEEDIDRAAQGTEFLRNHGYAGQVLDVSVPSPGVIVTPFLLGFKSVEELVNDGERDAALAVWERFREKQLAVWLGEEPEESTPTPIQTIRRELERSRLNFERFPEWKQLAAMPMVLNGDLFPSVDVLRAMCLQDLGGNPMRRLVVGHGDPHIGNVMALPHDPRRYKLIDTANAGWHDVAYEVAKPGHYPVYMAIRGLMAMPRDARRDAVEVKVRDGRHHIDYELPPLPPGAMELADMSLAFGRTFAQLVHDDGYEARLAASLWVCLWGGVRHHEGFPEVVPVLVGEAARMYMASRPNSPGI